MPQPTPVDVEARFWSDGRIEPLAFRWRGRRHAISGHGRQWRDLRGYYHFLVMTPPDQIWELAFDPTTVRWYLVRHPLRAQIV
ncbi:MAG: hypothetical protein Q9O62_08245 [Ardenticatenia bacterium]|nr:hypothetical protein [Ardenticatenia bacterium]